MQPMSDAARHVLHTVCLREDLPLDGWEHYYTAMSDTGASMFSYDRAAEDGAGWLRVVVDAEGTRVDWSESRRPEPSPATVTT